MESQPVRRLKSIYNNHAVAEAAAFLSRYFNTKLRKQGLNTGKRYSIMKHMIREYLKDETTNQENRTNRGFELLAPAGSFEIFQAVIEAGADAVYIGGDLFGARAYANNFSNEELLSAIDYAHLRGVKVYLTINTLLKNAELTQKLYDYLLPFYEKGLDAVLVQDMGVFAFLRKVFPDLPIHTSTQMTISGTEGVRLLQSLGAERVVMPREVSLSEMKRIHDETGMELEAFVHGALCYCYSGQCLFSSMLGGRSGNRGRCAQPCRLAYSVLDENKNMYQKDSYVLSLKDMCGIEALDLLWDAGVYSLKIEGRMKQASYAAGVVSYYRKYIDQFLAGKKQGEIRVNKADMQDILDLGNRCGFTDAYYSRQNGPDMVTFVKPSYTKTNEALQNKIVERYVGKEKKLPAVGQITLSQGQPAIYEVSYKTCQVCATGMEVMQALQKPLTAEAVRERMQKTGDTSFVMENVTVIMDENVFLPVKALNELRREAMELLQETLLASYRRDSQKEVAGSSLPTIDKKNTAGQTEYSCLLENRTLLSTVLDKTWITRVYLDFGAYRWNHFPDELRADVKKLKAANKEVYIGLPRVFRAKTADLFEQYIEDFAALPTDGVLVRNYEEFSYANKCWGTKNIVTDANLYTYNDCASNAFGGLGIARNTVPLELNRKEILHRDNSQSAMVVYGYYPLMTTAPCVHANTKGCDKKPGLCYLKDRYRTEFPVKNYCDACYNIVYNSLPVMLFANMEELRTTGMREFRVDFTVEREHEAKKVLSLMETFVTGTRCDYPPEWKDCYTNGHYKRGVE